jgi:hypothetical protein
MKLFKKLFIPMFIGLLIAVSFSLLKEHYVGSISNHARNKEMSMNAFRLMEYGNFIKMKMPEEALNKINEDLREYVEKVDFSGIKNKNDDFSHIKESVKNYLKTK